MFNHDEINAIITRAKDGDQRAKAEVLRRYRPLVAKWAKKRSGPTLQFDDTLSEGNIGLLRAIEAFDTTRGIAFGYYAEYWVRSYVDMYLHRNWSIVRRKSGFRYKAKSVLEAVQAGLTDCHLDFTLPSGQTLGESFLDPEPLPDENAMTDQTLRDRRASLDQRKNRLDTRERAILEARWPAQGDPLTLDQLSQRFGIARERVRQLEERALAKIGAPTHSQIMAAA
jgi:RNA polymerase sigma-32 factor